MRMASAMETVPKPHSRVIMLQDGDRFEDFATGWPLVHHRKSVVDESDNRIVNTSALCDISVTQTRLLRGSAAASAIRNDPVLVLDSIPASALGTSPTTESFPGINESTSSRSAYSKGYAPRPFQCTQSPDIGKQPRSVANMKD